jgi:tight adherence protein C
MMTMAILFLLFFSLLATSAGIAVYNILPDFERLKLSKRFHDDLGAGRETPGLFKILRIPILLFEDFAATLKMPKRRAEHDKALRSLGLEQLVSVNQLIALRLALVSIFTLYALLLLGALPLVICIAMPVFGWIYVDIWLVDKIRERKRKIKTELPFVLDTLTLSVEAGLEFTAGIARIATTLDPGPLRDELMIFLRQMQLGTSRREALKNLALRTDIQQVNSLVASLVQASEMGSSIGSALRTQSEIMSAERFSEAEKRGAEASQKLLIPMMIFIVPAVMLIILGPTLLSYVYGRGF